MLDYCTKLPGARLVAICDVDSKVLTPDNVDTPEGQKYVYKSKCPA